MNGLPIFMLSMLTTFSSGALTATQNQSNTTIPFTQLQQLVHEEEPTVAVKTPPETYTLAESVFVSQSFNNCGPAALSMLLSTYDVFVSQEELADKMRPYNNPLGGDDDKSVFPNEFVKTAKEYNFEAITRPNGDIKLLKTLLANDIPVVVRTWLNPGEDVGHFRIIRGYDDTTRVFIQDDSYQGKGLTYSYEQVMEMWKPFNYGYILVYPKDKQAVVEAILKENIDEKVAYQNALERASNDLKANPNDAYAEFNKSTALYHLGAYKESVESYDKAKDGLPDRILWYEYEPLYAYFREKNYDRIMEISEGILNSGNRAYAELYQLRGQIFLERGDKEAAQKEFELALYYNSNFEPAKNALASL